MIRLLSEIPAARGRDSDADVDATANHDIAARLRVTAEHLQSQDANPYRAASIRMAADIVAAQPRSLHAIYEERGRDGLDDLPGVGPGIAAIIDDILRARIAAEVNARRPGRVPQPPVQLLLEIEREYRAQGAPGKPGTASMPRELQVQRNGWNLRAFYSNSVRAHELGRTRDWVIVLASRGDRAVSQHTVVTETRGKLAGRRVVRGREAACRNHYARLGVVARTSAN